MEEIKTLLNVREKQLLQIKKEKEKSLRKFPDGKLRVCKNGEHVQFYRIMKSGDRNGLYIPRHDIALVQKLAQKDYDQRILNACSQELNAIQKYKKAYPSKNAESILNFLHEERQKRIIPIKESDEDYVHYWESKEYNGLGFYEYHAEYYTVKNERVRSKSEVIIADALSRENVPYKYECPLYLDNYGEVHPDFTVLNVRKRKELYWEHFGMMDDSEYVEKAIKKITCYQQNGLFPGEQLIITYETRQNPLNQKQVLQLIQHYLQ